MTILYFTGTGNSLYVAKSIGGECLSIPKLIKEGKYDFEDDKIGFVIPVYHGGVPKLVENFLTKVSLKSEYIFAVITYGAFSGTASRHLVKIGKRNNISFSYVNEILMVDNYLPMFDINKEIQNLPQKNIEENLDKIIEEIGQNTKRIRQNAVILELMRKTMDRFYDHEFEKRFTVNDKCNGCRTCERVCPVDNIKVDNKATYMNNCQHCLACIHHCPQKAISIKKEKNKSRYKNENISLKEIIQSNN